MIENIRSRVRLLHLKYRRERARRQIIRLEMLQQALRDQRVTVQNLYPDREYLPMFTWIRMAIRHWWIGKKYRYAPLSFLRAYSEDQ